MTLLILLIIFGCFIYLIGCHLFVSDDVYTKYYYYFVTSELAVAAIMVISIIFVLRGEWLVYG